MGEAKRRRAKGFGGSLPDISPWFIGLSPAIDPRLTRLVLGHPEHPIGAIIETYYPDEIDKAATHLTGVVARYRDRLKPSDLGDPDSFIVKTIANRALESRSTRELTARRS